MCYWNLIGYYERDGSVRFSGPCVVTGKQFSVVLSKQTSRRWLATNKALDELYEEVTPEVGRFLLFGISPDGARILTKHQLRSPDNPSDFLPGDEQKSCSVL